MYKISRHLLTFLYLAIGTMSIFSCSKNEEPLSEKKNPSANVTVNEKSKLATISVTNLPARSEVQLVYANERGQILAKGLTDNQGEWKFDTKLLVGFEQHLKVVIQENQHAKQIKTLDIPAAKQQLSQEQIETLLMKHTWNSVASSSRMLIKHQGSLPLDRFIGIAQKQFQFGPNGKFTFSVTSPLDFTDNKGTWSFDNQEISINTRIPLGPLAIKHVRINELTDSKLSLLAEISDGLFLIDFVPLN